jgi:phosphoribosylformylglycinamidine cyclo-ligase
MSVNDLIVCGARPLLFLDYYATSKLRIPQAKAVLTGVVEGCRQAGCPLVGGETAEMPGMYQGEDLDLAGFSVGLLDQDKVIDGSSIKSGDVVIGLESSGLHSNGYSLARKVLGETPTRLRRKPKSLGGLTVGEALLNPTRIYVSQIMGLLDHGHKIKGMAHVTGGGLPGNVNRILPADLNAVIHEGSWPEPPIFSVIAEEGPVERLEMFRTFNMGIGFVLIVAKKDAPGILAELTRQGEAAYSIGTIEAGGSGRVEIRPQA